MILLELHVHERCLFACWFRQISSYYPFFFCLFQDSDGPPGGGTPKVGIFVKGFEKLPLKTTILLLRDALITKFSLCID